MHLVHSSESQKVSNFTQLHLPCALYLTSLIQINIELLCCEKYVNIAVCIIALSKLALINLTQCIIVYNHSSLDY